MSANNKQRWITLSVVTAALFIKSALYRYICGMDGSLDAGQTVTAYIAVTAAALGLGTIGWCRGRWCVPVLMVIADLWFLAGSWYYLANHVWLNWSAVSTIGELRGFESSILSYLDWKQVLYPLSSFLAIEFLRRMPIGIAGKRDWLIAVSMVVVLGAGAAIGRKVFGLSEERKITSFRAEETFFICTHSTIGQIGYIIYDGLQEGAFNR